MVETESPNPFQLYNDYANPEHRFPAGRVVVHYEATGISSPPLNDDDRDHVPDYVERIGEAANGALAYYGHRSFGAVRPDSGGGDPRPDIYVSRFTPGTFGVALPAARAEGGAFVVVANNLDPSRVETFASLQATVAHELFHLVQFSYFPVQAQPPLPDWALEGTAIALAGRAFPEMTDLVWDIQLSPWLDAPGLSLTGLGDASWLFWRVLDARTPKLLPIFLARCAAAPAAACGAAGVTSAYTRLTGRPFAAAFHDFAVAAGDAYGADLRPRRVVSRNSGTFRASVPRMAIHYLRLEKGRHAPRLLVLRLPRTVRVVASISYDLASAIPGNPCRSAHIAPVVSSRNRKLTFRIPAHLLTRERVLRPTLILSNASATRAAAYTLVAR